MYIVNAEMIFDSRHFVCVNVGESKKDVENRWRIEADAINGKTYILLQYLTYDEALEAMRCYREGIRKEAKSINFEKVLNAIKK